MKKIIWRLKEQPNSDNLRELVRDGLLTKEEARQVLFSEDVQTDRDKYSLESEIKFLRELVEKLSKNRTEIIETIRYVEKPYYKYDWYKPYIHWCESSPILNIGTVSSGVVTDNLLGSTASNFVNMANTMFKDIQTF